MRNKSVLLGNWESYKPRQIFLENSPRGDLHVLHVPDLCPQRFLLVQSALVLPSGHLKAFNVKCVNKHCLLGETVSGRDDHTFRDDRPAADLLAVLVNSHVPRRLRHVHVLAYK